MQAATCMHGAAASSPWPWRGACLLLVWRAHASDVWCSHTCVHVEQAPVPVIDCGVKGPLRCTRCRSYVNPFCKFIENGAKFQCNMCKFSNTVPSDFYASVDEYGQRTARTERLELSRGSVDYVVPKSYYADEPAPEVGW